MSLRYNDFWAIVSIDFGTTFSGTCYAITRTLSQEKLEDDSYVKIIYVTDWPGQKNNEHKTPSINIYDQNFLLQYWGKEAFEKIRDGEATENNQIIMEKFKLHLPSSIAQKGAIHQTGTAPASKIENFRAAIDYFREIYDHTVSNIQKTIGLIEGTRLEKELIRFVITVPAQWNDAQRSVMRTIAKEAGLISEKDHENRLLIINESLAATLYSERKKVNRLGQAIHDDEGEEDSNIGHGHGLTANDKYIICDAGGGTIDLATFEFTGEPDDLNKNDSFRRCQLTADSGGECGSVFLDQRMQKLLLKVFFDFDSSQGAEDKETQREYEQLIAPYMEIFINVKKTSFGMRSIKFNFDCTHVGIMTDDCRQSSDDDSQLFDDDSQISDNSSQLSDNDWQSFDNCAQCVEEDYKFCEDDQFGDGIEFRVNGGPLHGRLKDINKKRDGVIISKDKTFDVVIFTLSYRLLRDEVFDPVIDKVLSLLQRQVNKANGDIKRTYLVGGFGCSPYLQKRIQQCFTDEKTGISSVGKLIIDESGYTAAMRGAMFFGIDGSRRAPQSDIVVNEFQTRGAEFNTLICIDIGYNGTACSYMDLNSAATDMTDINRWPGLNSDSFLIPTALDISSNKKPLWGAEVSQTTNLNPEALIVPSKLMAVVKGDLRIYLTKYLKLVHDYVHEVIKKEALHLSNKNKYRYVITMENCYNFFNNKTEMRRIAESAGIIDTNDPVERLLLIHRENAAAMYYEKKYFSKENNNSNHFLQINMYHDTCHLALHEATKITGYDQDAYNNDTAATKADSGRTKYFRNVRCMRSATFDFSFINRIVANLDSFVSKSVCIKCSSVPPHDTYNPDYYTGLREGFLSYVKEMLNFSNNDEDQIITITKSGCCKIFITVYDILEHVFRPAIRDLASEINRFATQVDMARKFEINKVFLSGILVETVPNTYSFIERILIKNLSEVMNIESGNMQASEDNRKEALLGAAQYGNHPEDFTERVSRKSYFVNVQAFVRKDFSDEAKKEMSKIKDKHEIYNLEAMYALIDKNQEVELYHQSPYNPSKKDESLKRGSTQATFLIHRGDKITEKDQMKSISKRFYAEKECIIYVIIYTSEDPELPEDKVNNVDFSKFQKIHQFELYLKKDLDNPMTKAPNSRLHFDIRLILDNNEVKFEANVCSRLGKKIPEFRFRDEILVANIYGDEQQIKVGDLTINRNNTIVAKETAIGSY